MQFCFRLAALSSLQSKAQEKRKNTKTTFAETKRVAYVYGFE